MNATKILWGQVLLVSITALAFVWAATEWTAWKLGFQPGLGHPWFEVFGWPVYHPPAFFWWWFAYDAYARDIFVCQSAPKIDPSSASKTDPLFACSWVVALAPSELVGVAQTGRARV
jgi:type IV secretory pathway TraG/TraD family ATPase VirD4